MAGKYVLLNGASYTPNDVQVDEDKIGTETTAANGAYHLDIRATKRTWKLIWRRVPAVTRAAIRAVYGLATSFAFVDEDGGSPITVACPPGGLRSSISLIGPGVTLYYDVELTLKEC